jgi:vacuolar protein sorting-associated protein 52
MGSRRSDDSVSPHGITLRYSSLALGLLSLCERDDEPLVNSLGRVRSDFEAFLTKWSASLGDNKRERFLHNNYWFVRSVISVCCFEVD